MHLIIGAGGTASWLVPLLKRMLPKGAEIKIVDGDLLEERNLDRQLFTREYLGWNKAEALAEIYGTDYSPEYAQPDSAFWQKDLYSCLWCCADNHPARKLCLEMVDEGYAMMAIIGGNEYNEAEAYPYLREWKGGSTDPRNYYPELLTETAGDPLTPLACQGVAQAQNRQLALFNYLSAGFMVHLYQFITVNGQEVTIDFWPTRHFTNFATFHTKYYQIT